MRKFITAAVLTLATMAGIQARPPSGGQSGHSGHSGQGTVNKVDGNKHLDLKHTDHNPMNHNHSDSKKFDRIGSGKYVSQHGKKFSQGYYYYGKDHYHWSFSCYWPKYRCDCYYCPDTLVWYYWCQPRLCYLPVSCIEAAPPVEVATATATATAVNSVNVNVNSAPVDLPPVLPSGPAGAGPVQPFKAPPMK